MTLLYRNMKEYSRVTEEVSLTEEGSYKAGRVPDDYGGAILTVEIVHKVTMVDGAGAMHILEFSNSEPLNKDKSSTSGSIILDGTSISSGSGDPRTWTTKSNSTLAANTKALGDITHGIMTADGVKGSPT